MSNDRRNPFQRFPKKGPLKLLVYGDAGTEKTRRALVMPGPVWVIDMENGSSDYAALVAEDRDWYVPTKSHRKVLECLQWVANLPRDHVGTVVIDPIGGVWESIKQAHIERMMRVGKYRQGRNWIPINDPEEVPFEIGTWGKLKRTYGDLLSMLITAPYHVVMVARGKDATNHKGEVIGYKYEGEKSTIFLANVVIQSHAEGDIVIKDRTGTYPSGKRERVDFLSLLPNTGTDATPLQTDSAAAKEDGAPEKWTLKQQKRFMARLKEATKDADGDGLPYDDFARWCEAHGRPRPSLMPSKKLDTVLKWLEDGGLAAVWGWLGEERALDDAAPETSAGLIELRRVVVELIELIGDDATVGDLAGSFGVEWKLEGVAGFDEITLGHFKVALDKAAVEA